MKIQTTSRFYTPYALSNGVWRVLPLFPPQHRKTFHDVTLDEILQERVSSSRNRINPRGVKRKMSSYPLRPRKRQPTKRINFAKSIKIVK